MIVLWVLYFNQFGGTTLSTNTYCSRQDMIYEACKHWCNDPNLIVKYRQDVD